MLEFLNYLFSPKKFFQDRKEAKLKTEIDFFSTSYILEFAESENLKDYEAKILFIELARRVKGSGIPLDDWL